MKLGLITYDYPHLKTEQVAVSLAERTEHEVALFALPFVARKERHVFFPHRPDQTLSLHTRDLARVLGFEHVPCREDSEIPAGLDIYLVLAGKVLSESCVTGKRILNCHAGAIPAVRGLDAFKWAVYDCLPLANTLHLIDAEIDAGELVAVVRTPVSTSDSMETLARRHYEMEIQLLVDFERYLDAPRFDFDDLPVGKPRRRMSMEREAEMARRFTQYQERFGQ